MFVIDLLELATYVFVKLNDIKNIRKIYLNDLINYNDLLNQEAKFKNIEYFCKTDYESYKCFRYNSNGLCIFFEDNDGYVIKLSNELNIDSIKYSFNISQLDELSENINIEDIFIKDEKILKKCNFSKI